MQRHYRLGRLTPRADSGALYDTTARPLQMRDDWYTDGRNLRGLARRSALNLHVSP